MRRAGSWAGVAFGVALISTHCLAVSEPGPVGSPEFCRVGPVGAIVLQPDGKILIADGYGYSLLFLDRERGVFGRVPGGVFRLHADGAPDLTFVSEFNQVLQGRSHVFARWLDVQQDGKVLVLGTNWSAVRLMPDGALDTGFALQNLSSNTPGLNVHQDMLLPFAVTPDGQLAIRAGTTNKNCAEGGSFALPMPTVYWLDDSGRGEQETVWGEAEGVDAIVQSWGLNFWRRKFVTQGRPERTFLFRTPLRFPADEPFINLVVPAVLKKTVNRLPLELYRLGLRLPNGQCLLGIASPGRNNGKLLRFNSDWSVDPGFEAAYEINVRPNTILLRAGPNGTVLISGDLKTINGRPATGLTRLLPNGETDQTFVVTFSEPFSKFPIPYPAAVAVQPDGAVLVGGFFTSINGYKCTYFARLFPDGSVDRKFTDRFESYRLARAFEELRAPSFSVARYPGKATSAGSEVPERANTAATEPQDIIRLQAPVLSGATATISFEALPSRSYILQASDGLQAPWRSVSTNRTDTAGKGSFTDSTASGAGTWLRFYRVMRFATE